MATTCSLTNDLHEELIARLGTTNTSLSGSNLYAVTYRVVEPGQPNLDVWQETLELSRNLPTLPLWLRGVCIPVDLDTTYQRTCREQRISLNFA